VGAADDTQLREILGTLHRRWRVVAGFAGAGLVVMAIASLLVERCWTATAMLHVKNQPPHVTNIQQVVTPPSYLEGVEFFQDQVKFLESRSLAARVIRDQGLEGEPAFTGADQPGLLGRAARAVASAVLWPLSWLRSGDGDETPAEPPVEPVLGVEPRLIARYARGLEVQPITNSRLIEVRFTSPSAGLSQRIANAHARDYILQNLESKFQLTGEARTFLQGEIDRVQRELDTAEQALSEFRHRNTVISLDDRENAIAERLGDLGRRLTDAEASRIAAEAESRLVTVREGDSLPSVLTNSLIQGLKQEVSRLEVRHAELSEVFVPASQQVKEIDSQLKRAQGRLAREIARASAGLQSAYLAAQAREEKLRQQFQLQQEAMLNLKDISGQYIKLDQAVTTTRALHGTLLQRLQETDVVKGMPLSNVTVVDPAERPSLPSYPNIPFNLAFGLLLGGGLGLALAFARESLDSSLATPDEVRAELALPTLGVVPDFERLPTLSLRQPGRPGGLLGLPGRGAPPALIAHRAASIEAYRSIRTSVLFFNPERPPRSILVTSSTPREGKTATSVNLALSLAQLSRSVILVDADMRHASCHRALRLAARPGLTDVLRGAFRLPQAIERLAVRDGQAAPPDAGWSGAELHLLQAGQPVDDPSSLLASHAMDELLESLLNTYETVLIDSPPVFPITDSAVLAPRVDGVVLVVRCHRTGRDVTREALTRLACMHSNVLGVVLNGVDPTSSAYRSYAYYLAA